MQNVAHHLQKEAVKLQLSMDEAADTYARSAYNRYYYGAFLCVRSALVKIDEKYERSLKHKDVPQILRGTIKERLSRIEKKAIKLADRELLLTCKSAKSKTIQFADTLEKAYAVRSVADYEPAAKVNFLTDRFSLAGVGVTDAHEWLAQADLWSSLVLNAIRQENV